MALDTQAKLQKILEKHTQYREDLNGQITAAEKSLREAIQVKQFGENDIMKKIRRQYAKYIHDINEVLLYKEELTDEDRNRLWDKRKMYIDFLQLFSSATITIEGIDKWINSEFEDEFTDE